MKGDFTRHTFRPERHYSGVRMQQGRVQLDADWNEQADILRYRDETEAADVLGRCGGPLHAAAFGITLDPARPGDFLLGAGRYYVDGMLCENEDAVAYTEQQDLPGLDPLELDENGFFIVYLDVWQRHLTALDDPRLRETALGGPDTATRTRTVWQVRTVFAGANVNCLSNPAAYTDATAPGTARLRARAESATIPSDPCLVPSSAGFRGLENQLYRVEVHNPGSPYDLTAAAADTEITDLPARNEVVYAGPGTPWTVGQAVEVFLSGPGSDPTAGFLAFITARNTAQRRLTLNVELPPLALSDLPRLRRVEATYKWSRDNGSVVALVRSIADREVVVHSLGTDSVLNFQAGQWLELTDDERELAGEPGTLAQIESVDPATNTITLRSAPTPFPGDVADPADPARHLKARRWDGAGAAKVNAPPPSDGFVELEEGVQISFETGDARTGDYWLIPARTATADAQSGTIEWPADGTDPAALLPLGIEHHYCKLGLLEWDGTTLEPTDCRSLFPPTTELATLFYVGGDGQETLPGEPMPQLLEVGVFRGRWPVAEAPVTFTAEAAGVVAENEAALGGASNSFSTTTDADGIASCVWRPDADLGNHSQQVRVVLLDAAGAELDPEVHFNGTLSLASRVSYTPDPACTDLATADTVQEALDLLCRRRSEGCSVVVRPEDRLDEVIRTLIEGGARDLCLCLTVGDHTLPDGLQVEADDVVIRIIGCGAGTRLAVRGPFAVAGAGELTIRTLHLTLAQEPIVLRSCTEVGIASCTIRRTEQSERELVSIGGAQRIGIVGNVLDARTGDAAGRFDLDELRAPLESNDRRVAFRETLALARKLEDDAFRESFSGRLEAARRSRRLTEPERRALAVFSGGMRETRDFAGEGTAALLSLVAAATAVAAGPALSLGDGNAETLLADNEIVGDVTLYGSPLPEVVLTLELLRALRALQANQQLALVASPATFHARDNTLTRLALGDDVVRRIADAPSGAPVRIPGVFRGLHLTDNTLALGQNQILAEHAVLTGTHFDQGGEDLGGVIANSAIYTANFAPNDVRLFDVSAQTALAANLGLNIVEL